MRKVRILTDTTCDLPESLLKEYSIKVIPFPVALGEEIVPEGKVEEFLGQVKRSRAFPKTSALRVEELVSAHQELSREGQSVVSIHVSSDLSSPTHQALRRARARVPEASVEVVDTRQALGGVGLVVLAAARAASQGEETDQVAHIARETVSEVNTIFALPDLEYLHRGGRIGRAKSLLGSLLKVIPIVALRNQEGTISPAGKARDYQQVNQRIVRLIRTDMEEIRATRIRCLVNHAGNEPAAEDLMEALRKGFRLEELIKGRLSCCAVVHLGPGAWWVGYQLLR